MSVHCASTHGVYYVDGRKIVFASKTTPRRVVLALDAEPSTNRLTNVSHLKVNNSDTLLAIAFDRTVEVWPLALSNNGSVPRPVTFVTEAPVRALDWQPSARHDAGLVALTEHRLTSVYCPPDQPPVVERMELNDTDNLSIDLVGFSFGASDSPLGHATLYFGSQDGDIYRLCPFISPAVEVLPEEVSDLKNLVPAGDWLAEFDSWSDTKQAKTKVLKRRIDSFSSLLDAELASSVQLSPLTMKPYPYELYEEDCLDIRAGNAGLGADILVQTTQHYVNFFVSWSLQAGGQLTLVSSVQFKSAETVRKIEVFTQNYAVITVGDNSARGRKRTHLISITALMGFFEDGESKPSNEKGNLVKIESFDYGMPYFTRRELVLLPEDTRNISRVREWAFPTSSNGDPAELFSLLKIDERNEKFALLSNPKYLPETLEALKSQIDLNPNFTVAAILEANAKSLLELSDIAGSYQSQILVLYKLIVTANYERQARERDLTSQIAACHDLITRVDCLSNSNSKSDDHKDPVKAAIDRNESFFERLEKIRKNIDSREHAKKGIAPSRAEQSWFAELSKAVPAMLQRQTELLSQLQDQLDRLKAPAQVSASNKKLSWDQIIEIQRRLRDQSASISSLEASSMN